MAGDTVYLDNGNYSCTTKQLKDKSGLKIICNGDSIGVVLNGAAGKDGANGNDGKQGIQGEKGDDGIGCTIAAQTDSLVTIMCGGKSMTLNLRANGVSFDTASVDTLELDSEKVAISLDSLAGYSQKGPFLKGSTVYLYELSDGRTLKQTNGNFTSEIKKDDGRYKFTSRNLVSQYALLVADGKYYNEVTGRPTNTAIKLQAYTNMLSRKSANVNLLTHLEKDRVFYLVTQEKKTVRAAKKQAQAEILEAFHIDASKFEMESEDLDVFGKTDADARSPCHLDSFATGFQRNGTFGAPDGYGRRFGRRWLLGQRGEESRNCRLGCHYGFIRFDVVKQACFIPWQCKWLGPRWRKRSRLREIYSQVLERRTWPWYMR